jgi:RNA polymerase sigma-70 factor (ECF subfamily)
LKLAHLSDRELIEAIRQNDSDAFKVLFDRYWKRVHTIAYSKIRCEEVTKEIVQELFISLWDKRATLQVNHLPSYLYTATKNRILNYIASEAVQKRHWNNIKESVPLVSNVTENDVQLNELLEALEKGIDNLPEKSRLIFKLNRLEGRSVAEIATFFKLSEKAIQYHITSCLKKLRVSLKEYTGSSYLLFVLSLFS